MGVPSTCSSSGVLMIVVPNKLALVISSPSAATNRQCKQSVSESASSIIGTARAPTYDSHWPEERDDDLDATSSSSESAVTDASVTVLVDLVPTNISWKAEALCRQLVQQYRVNLLEQSLFQDRGFRLPVRRVAGSLRTDSDLDADSEMLDVNFFRLVMATMNGDVRQVRIMHCKWRPSWLGKFHAVAAFKASTIEVTRGSSESSETARIVTSSRCLH